MGDVGDRADGGIGDGERGAVVLGRRGEGAGGEGRGRQLCREWWRRRGERERKAYF